MDRGFSSPLPTEAGSSVPICILDPNVAPQLYLNLARSSIHLHTEAHQTQPEPHGLTWCWQSQARQRREWMLGCMPVRVSILPVPHQPAS